MSTLKFLWVVFDLAVGEWLDLLLFVLIALAYFAPAWLLIAGVSAALDSLQKSPKARKAAGIAMALVLAGCAWRYYRTMPWDYVWGQGWREQTCRESSAAEARAAGREPKPAAPRVPTLLATQVPVLTKLFPGMLVDTGCPNRYSQVSWFFHPNVFIASRLESWFIRSRLTPDVLTKEEEKSLGPIQHLAYLLALLASVAGLLPKAFFYFFLW